MLNKKLTAEELEIAEGMQALVDANNEFLAGWPHFCKKINWNETALDAEAIRFFNEVPGNINAALKNLGRLKRKCQKEVT